MATLPGDKPHGQENEDTDMDDRSLGSLFEVEVPENATRYLPGAMRWADGAEVIGEASRFGFACKNFLSIGGTSGNEFYLSAEDSKALILHIARNPGSFPPAPQPVPSQHIRPQRQNQLQQAIPTAQQQGAALWTEPDDGKNIYPRRDYASVAGRYDSYHSGHAAEFWLNGKDTNGFFRHIIANPDRFPFGPAPTVPNPLGGQLMNITHRFDQLVKAHDLVGKEPYGGEMIHGSQQMYQYARVNGLDPRQYAQSNKWQMQGQGPPPDQVNYDSTMSGGNGPLDEGYNSFYSDFQDGRGDQDDPSDQSDKDGQHDQSNQHDKEDEIKVKQAEDQVFSDSGWEMEPGRMDLYRLRFPNSEARRCQTCTRRRAWCRGWLTHTFPCDTCIEAKMKCVRQTWQYQRKKRPIEARKPREKAKGRVPASTTTAGLPQTNRGDMQVKFCFRCKKNDLACDGQNPCNMCLADGSPEFCGDYDNLGLPWSFEENETGDEYGRFGGNNEMGGGGDGDVQMNDDHLNRILSFNKNFDPQLLAQQDPQSVAGPARNIGESIIAGALPSGLPEPNVLHHFVLPIRPHPLKRPAPDAGADDDDAGDETEEPQKKKRGTRKGPTKAKIARENAVALRWMTPIIYDPRQNKILDPLSLPESEVDDPMVLEQPMILEQLLVLEQPLVLEPPLVLDQPPRSVEFSGQQRSELVASTWKIWGLPPKPSRFSNRALVPEHKQQKCVENVNHWTINPFVDCDRTPTRLCQEMSDNRRYTDVSCHDRQEIAAARDERAVIEKSKLLYCEPCYFDLRLNINQAYVHLQVCQCAWQMTRTWLCNKDRVKARHEFITRIGARKMDWLNAWGNVCPMCKTRPPEEGINAWQCCACEAQVFRDPMVP